MILGNIDDHNIINSKILIVFYIDETVENYGYYIMITLLG